MYLVKPSFLVLGTIDGNQILSSIERAGRTCYKSDHLITEDSAKEFVRKIIKRGHESVLEHESISVRFVIDRGVSHELVRHRLCAFSQESTRYCDYVDGKVEFILPPWYDKHGASVVWERQMVLAEIAYKALRRKGWSPQQARSVLPNSLKTEIVATANLREWRHIFRLRTALAAHPQMREIMRPLLKEFRKLVPVVFDDVGEV